MPFLHPAVSACTLPWWQHLLLLLHVSFVSYLTYEGKIGCCEGCCNTSPVLPYITNANFSWYVEEVDSKRERERE